MIYIGHFSFDELGPEKEVRHGYFSCVVEAEEIDAAINKFKDLIIISADVGHLVAYLQQLEQRLVTEVP